MITNEDFHLGLGLPRSGKTLSQIEILLDEILNDIEVYSNTWINLDLPTVHLYSEFEEIAHLRNCVVHIDEICHILDPRDWASESKDVRDFFQLHGHRHVGLITNTQHISLVPKSALIEVSRYFMCEKLWNSELTRRLFPNFPWIVVNETEMTLQEIKAEENGYTFKNNFDDEDDEWTMESGSDKTIWFNKNEIMHRELNDLKKELVHWYCPKCKQRQGQVIKKEDSELYAEFDRKKGIKVKKIDDILIPSCPKHKCKLEIKESGIYDSYYEFERIEKEIVFRPYYKAVKEMPYKGRLSAAQLELKNKLESEVNIE